RASVVSGLVVRPAPARSLVGVVRRVVRTRLVFQIVELVQLPEQRLQAQFGGGIPVGLTGEPLGHARGAFVVALRSDRSRVPVGFFSLAHGYPFLAPVGLLLISVAFTWAGGSIDAAAVSPAGGTRRARTRRGPQGRAPPSANARRLPAARRRPPATGTRLGGPQLRTSSAKP